MRNILATLAAAAIIASTLIAGAAETQCPAGAAVAKRSIVSEDGTIRVITRCVQVSK